jgi:hypothetical protein
MSRSALLALGLWAVFAALVFSVVFDVHTRAAAADFMAAQYHRRVQGAPLATIDGGFRPLMHAAAWRAAPWPIAILVVAAGATLAAERHSR